MGWIYNVVRVPCMVLSLGVTSVMFLSINVSVVAVTGFTSVSMIFDSMMGIFVAAVLAKYVNYSTAVVLVYSANAAYQQTGNAN